MSSMEPQAPGTDPTTQQQKEQGAETFLSPEERKQLQRLMGHPSDYPKEMMAHIKSWLEVNPPDIPIGQIKGNKGVPRYIDRQTDAMTSVGSTSAETTMYSFNLKAKTLSPTGQLRIFFAFTVICTDVDNEVTFRIKLGATTVLSFDLSHASLDSNARLGVVRAEIVNAGSYGSQIGLILGSTPGGSPSNNGTSAVDTSQDQTLSITADWVSAGSTTIDPQYIAVEVFNPVGV